MGQSGGKRGGRDRQAPSEAALGAARHPARRGRVAADAQGPASSAPGTTGGRRTCWTAWSTRSCATRNPTGSRRSPGRSASHRLRNNGSWVNDYYDDMAWLALALERAGRLAGVEKPGALKKLSEQFLNAWVPEDGGGIPWRKQDQFFNAPANGPAGIFLARYDDRLRRAQQMSDWIDETLIDPETHLVFDGIKAGSMVRAQYTYCQGVVLGLETELAARTQDADHAQRVHRLVAAVRREHGARRRHQGRGRRRRRPVQRDPGALPGAGRHHAAGTHAKTPKPRDTARNTRAQVRAVGVGLPADRRRPAAVRTVLGPHRRDADGGRAGRPSSSRAPSTPPRSPSATCRCSCRAGC